MRRILITALLAALVLVSTAGAGSAQAQTAVNPAAVTTSSTWSGYYYNNPDWSGTPVRSEQTPFLSFNWGQGSPGPGVPVDNFTARYDSDVYFYAGTYRFTIVADDEITLIINGVNHADTRGKGLSGKTVTRNVTFPHAGMQRVTLFYREYTSGAYVRLDWTVHKARSSGGSGSGAGGSHSGANQCTPVSADSVKNQYGNYRPCMRQNMHQSSCFMSTGAWNAPTASSIMAEPQIEYWRTCSPDKVMYFSVSCDPAAPQQAYRCSKTGAGWYRY